MLLASGLFAASANAGPPSGNPGNPFQEILNKLEQIQTDIGRFTVPEGNPTLRWDQVLPGAQRFVVLVAFNNEAVLDKETGLVWEQTPQPTITLNWSQARTECLNSRQGGRRGWRLPSITELESLADPSVPSPGPVLTPGHPFTNIQSAGLLVGNDKCQLLRLSVARLGGKFRLWRLGHQR